MESSTRFGKIMSDRNREGGSRRWVLFGFALLFGLSTAVVLVLSVSGLRDRIGFERITRRIDQFVRAERYDDEYRAAIEEAAEFARTRAQFMQLLGLAWNLEESDRWPAVISITAPARERHRSELAFVQIESYARIRSDDRETAATMLDGYTDATSLRLRILAVIDPTDREASRRRLIALAAGENQPALFTTVSRAFDDPNSEALYEAWEEFGARAFAVNGALAAAGAGDRDAALRAVRPLRSMNDDERVRPTLYLAAWLDDDQWLFSQLRSLEGRRLVEPELFLLQADGHIRQGQFREARAIYREIIATDPGASEIPYINLAVINERLGDGPIDELYRTALPIHPRSRALRFAWSSRLVRRGNRLEAARVIAPVALTPGDHESWLLARAVLGARRPVARLESDLWGYINSYPDALEVAAFLARFLYIRNDAESLAVLRNRYAPGSAPWSRIVHALHALDEDRPHDAETMLAGGESLDLAYDRAVFALHHRDATEIARTTAAYREEFERDVRISTTRRTEAEILSLLLEAEAARLAGDAEASVAYLERAKLIGYPSTQVARYRTLLAGSQ